MSDSFICSICGQEHIGLVTDWAYKLPHEVWAIPEAERSEKARFNNDLCQFDERNFIRCVLDMPFAEASGNFGWGVWAEVDWPTFERYLELYDEDGNSEPTHLGKLANALPAYSGSLGTPVVIQFRDPSKRPSLYLKPGDESRLALEQRAGINEARYHEILNIIGQA
ncbi:DUF2199 domain-containing protein [Sphingobium nicotianae]|uniref:DUF2199 domain-containing protein n=1 Tax=Sphingobium nicotianae TaxID=2782607 RepID=A0A9X1DBR7_9SPHN|nr:DUF2199 domain-containing protein [Sphingobium nicotianae]MBT2187091.1 DUF2199 domain-containing protein [Sphingobium nicotianae]